MSDLVKDIKESEKSNECWPVVQLEYTGEKYTSPPASPRPFPLEAASEAWIKGRQLYLEKHPEEIKPPTDWSFLFKHES